MSWNAGLARIGAVLYVLWGLVHYNAVYGVYQLDSWPWSASCRPIIEMPRR